MTLQINDSRLFDKFFDKSSNRKVNFLVLHHIKSSSLALAIKELKTHKVSAHYIIEESGKIHLLVKEENIAYHAGISYWNKKFNLNDESIGIEFLCSNPYEVGFSDLQIKSGIELCQNIVKKYNIQPKNIMGHSDIAYDKETNLLNRKDDPSHLFPWDKFAKNNISIWPSSIRSPKNDEVLFKIGDFNLEIAKIKHKLARFGYKIDNPDENFDKEFANLTAVFNRRFNPNKYTDYEYKWLASSSKILKVIS